MRQAELGLWTNGVEGAIVGHRAPSTPAKTMLELISRQLREVTVRPAVGADERIRWDALMGAHHYLPLPGLGRAKCAPRRSARRSTGWRSWVGTPARSSSRPATAGSGGCPSSSFAAFHLIANNARFLILPECAAANLASRVLGLSLRRLSGDFRAMHGHPILIAETFVDPARFTGACYRAANWQALGHTRGFARKPGTPATWVPHGRPKEVLVYPLARDAREQLCRLDDAPKWRSEGDPRPWTAHRLRSLWECLHGVPDFRSTRGRRYPLATILAIAVAAKLAGYHGATAIGEFSQALTQHQLRALRAFYSPRLGRFTAPSTTAFVKVLTNLDPDVLDRAARTWAAQQASRTDPVAIDGKYIRGAARHNPGAKHLLVAAAEHRSGIVLGQEAVEDKSNEIPAVRTLVTGLDLTGRVVTLDAMHTNHHTARCLVEQCGAHYVMTAVKDNCPNLLADLAGLDWELPQVRATEHHTSDKGHGRIEKRSCRVLDLTEHRDRAPPASSSGRLSHRARAAHRQDRQGRARDRTRPDLRAPRPSHPRRSSWPWCAGIGASKIDSTTCATSPTTKTAAGCEPATCRAISPASRTSPSPSFASRGASTPSPKPTGTTLGGPRTPCASSSTRPNAEPHATATPRRLAPPPRQRSRSPGRAIRASGLLCIPLQTTQIPSSVTSPSSHSTGYPTTTTDSNQSRAHPCTEQNFTLAL